MCVIGVFTNGSGEVTPKCAEYCVEDFAAVVEEHRNEKEKRERGVFFFFCLDKGVYLISVTGVV